MEARDSLGWTNSLIPGPNRILKPLLLTQEPKRLQKQEQDFELKVSFIKLSHDFCRCNTSVSDFLYFLMVSWRFVSLQLRRHDFTEYTFSFIMTSLKIC